MKKIFLLLSFSFVILFFLGQFKPLNPSEYLQEISVTIDLPIIQGSGVIKQYGDKTYILTVNHLFETEKDKKNIHIKKKLFYRNRCVGELNLKADFIVGSDYYDLAILSLEHSYNFSKSFTLYKGELPLGSSLWCISSPFGFKNHNHISVGVLAANDHKSTHKRLDSIDLGIAPGSSGGGVFTPEGELVGVVSMMYTVNIGYMVPASVIREWLKSVHMGFLQ